ncbi:MAG: DUF885 domain-containing protein [Pacificimonas sp.]
MNRILIAALLASAAAAAPTLAMHHETEATTPAVAEYEALRDEIWEWTLDNSPLLATGIGDPRGQGKLGDLSEAGYDRRLAETRVFLARLDAIDTSALPADLAVDLGVVRQSFADGVAAAAHDHDRYVLFTNRGGWHMWFAGLADSGPFFTLEDYRSYVDRLDAYEQRNRDGIARSRQAVARGLTQPCEPMKTFRATIDGRIAETAEESSFWTPFAEKPGSISDADWAALKARAKTIIEGEVFPAYREFREFYVDEYEPNCRQTVGVSETPGGRAYYDYRVASFTTTDMTADEVHELGLSEVARISAEMETVAASAGYPGDRDGYIEHLRADPQYYPKTGDELMEYTGAITKQIDGFMPELFGTLPRLPYTVKPIPDDQAIGNTTAYYESGSLETGRAGVYRVNLTALDQRPLWEVPALSVHEAVPGHHHQISLQQELDIHPIRRHGTYFTAFVEGWGLYSERLGIEMGLYDTPAKEMGRLSYEMWRASRLVVDTGLHAKGWSKQRAVDFMLDNTALSPANIDAEVNRYITWPGQALAYKVGELKIRELRTRAETALGADFDLRTFHDAVLENGSVPLDVLEAHIDRWIAEQQAS